VAELRRSAGAVGRLRLGCSLLQLADLAQSRLLSSLQSLRVPLQQRRGWLQHLLASQYLVTQLSQLVDLVVAPLAGGSLVADEPLQTDGQMRTEGKKIGGLTQQQAELAGWRCVWLSGWILVLHDEIVVSLRRWVSGGCVRRGSVRRRRAERFSQRVDSRR